MPAPMTEFEGAPFQIVHEGEWLPMWEPTSNYNVVPIPGSNSSVTFLMGTGVLTATLDLARAATAAIDAASTPSPCRPAART